MVYIPSLGVPNRYRINQAIPSVQSTSYNYWSPYSAGGDIPTPTASPGAASDTNSDVTTSARDANLSSDIPTASLIQITALPPATTSPPAVLPKLPYHSQVNIFYLIPLFITLGVVLGAITAVISLKWREYRRHLRRTSTLLPGPPYAQPGNDAEDRLLVYGYPSMEQVSLFAASTPSKFTVHGSRYVPKRILDWQTHGTARPPHSQLTYTQTIIPSSDGESFTVVTPEDPFLAPSNPMAMRESPTFAFPTIRILPSVPEPISADNHNEKDTNLSKPFRRSMFDILKLNGLYRPEPSARDQYTVLAPDGETVDTTSRSQVHKASSSKEISFADASRSRSTRPSLDGGFHVGEMEDALGLLGFRDDKQDLADDPVILPKQNLRLEDGTSSSTRGAKMRKPRKVSPFATESTGLLKEAIRGENDLINVRKDGNDEGTHHDIYTMAPQRRRSRTPHKNISASGVSRRSSASDTHASILPLSPPSLMSPPLEKSLFFTSTSSSSSTSLVVCMNSFGATDTSPAHHIQTGATKKLRTSRQDSPLPYPSYPEHAHAQPTPRKGSSSPDIKPRMFSPRSPNPKGHSTSAIHRESTTGISSLGSLSPTSLAVALASSSSTDMLNKVNNIVAQGYIQRRMSIGGVGGNLGRNLPESL